MDRMILLCSTVTFSSPREPIGYTMYSVMEIGVTVFLCICKST